MTEKSIVTKFLNGKGIAQDMQDSLRTQVAGSRVKPGLGVVLVGFDPASKMYVHFKTNASTEVGIFVDTIELPEDAEEKKVVKAIEKFNASRRIHGILVQLPLPKHLDPKEIVNLIDPQKDVDGLTATSLGRLTTGLPGFMPATVKGILRLLDEAHCELNGAEVVIINASTLIGKPLSTALLNLGATVTICRKSTKDLASHTKGADVIISAVGTQNLITAGMVREDAVIIDAGISKSPEGKTVGDVDFEEVAAKASYITPVPGGVGPMTVASLLQNTWQAMRWLEGYEPSPFDSTIKKRK